jgi:hypothetical protein
MLSRFFKKVYNKVIFEASKLKPLYHASYSQCGEDMIARYYLHQQEGFYVDIGAYHPRKISNTYFFYKKGWKGINVDGSKKAIELFNKMRPRDINLHCCVGLAGNDDEVDFYMFNSSELNTFKKNELEDILKYHGQSPVAVEKIRFQRLESILELSLPENTHIDLLSVDAEGADEDVLRSNNWSKFRPRLIIVENHSSVYEFIKTGMHQLLIDNNYTLGGYSRHSYVFHDVQYTAF